MNSLLGQKFTFKDPTHFAHGRECEVIEELDYSFVGGAKRVPAVRFKILPADGVTLRPRDKFEQEMIPLPVTETAATKK